MKRPSNIIIGFILAVAGIFLTYGLGRMFLQVIKPPEVKMEEDFTHSRTGESRLYNRRSMY
ncbi:hypothetical protein I4641_22590 [Waterburya agarophytonicola K14]|uniref:Uncharacterized protein n=1 Tax=Waterburya agarophytonicola KI4 TaxID=2874699 RepID=A0A964BTW1_9CYAN|nr:hypothetical protein [Waterburya agarophytonicola]MCC0179734.1 hypothetical protein [Waterburya agarophytonicola KI4]